MKPLALIFALIAAPVHAGGLVIADDAEVIEPRRDNVLPLILLGVAIAVLIGVNAGNCNSEPVEPEKGC